MEPELTQLTESVIGAAMEVHRALGPGLLESTYEMCLCRELAIRELAFERQKSLAVEYKGVKLDCGYRADLVVEGLVLVEVKQLKSDTDQRRTALELFETRWMECRSPLQLQRAAVETRDSSKGPKS